MQKIGDQEIRWPIAVLLIIIGATYFTGLDNEFVFDDLSVLKNNICLGDLSTLKHLFTWDYFATFSEYTYRPLGSFTYWFDAWIWGHRSFGYHVTNLILHLATVAALFGLVHALGGNFRSAFLTATVFGLNPVFSEAVYCSGFREDLLVALTSILVLTVVVSSSRHLSGRRRVGLAGWLFVLALFSKESAAAIPPVCLITLLFNSPGIPLNLVKDRKRTTGILFCVLAGYLYLRFSLLKHPLDSLTNFHGGSFFSNLINVPRSYMLAMWKFLLPVSLAPDYPLSFWNEQLFWAGACLLILIISAIALAFNRRERFPLITFGFLGFVTIFSVTANWIPIPQFFGERYLYLPGALLSIAAGSFLDRILTSIETLPSRKMRVLKPVAAILTAALFTGYIYGTRTAAGVWASEYNLWTHTLQKRPRSSLAREHIGAWWVNSGNLPKARDFFIATRALDPSTPEPLANLVSVSLMSGDYKEAKKLIRQGLDEFENTGIFQTKAGFFEASKGDHKKAEIWFRKALEVNPYDARPLYHLGRYYLSYNHLDEAGEAAREYRRKAPGDPQGVILLADIFEAEDNLYEAWRLLGWLNKRLPGDAAVEKKLDRITRLKQIKQAPKR